MKNKLGSQNPLKFICYIYKFNACFKRLENLVYHNNPFIIYTVAVILAIYNIARTIINSYNSTQSTEYYKTDISKYIAIIFHQHKSYGNIKIHLENLFFNPAYLAAFLFGLKISAGSTQYLM